MKAFYLFAGHEYEAAGGFHNYMGAFDTLDAARAEALAMIAREPRWKYFVPDWWHIVDINSGNIVAEGDRRGETVPA